MQVSLRVWYDMGSPTHTPIHDATCGSHGLLDSLHSSLLPASIGKEAVGITALLTHRQTAPHPNQSSRPWPSLSR